MPFQELAERTNGQILGASYLNALSENVEWVFGAAQAANMPFQGYRTVGVVSIGASDVYWYVRHRLRYFHYFVNVNDPLLFIRLKVSDGTTTTTLFADEAPGATQSWTAYADANALTVGTWYKIWWEIEFDTGTNAIWVNYMAESDATAFDSETPGAWSVPPRWARGDTVSHTDMNLYKTALDTAHTQLGDVQWNVPVRKNNTLDRGYFLVNRHRWLHYVGDGEIVDPSGAGATVDIAGSGSVVQVYDLRSVDWLAEGSLYEVKDCLFACEDYAA